MHDKLYAAALGVGLIAVAWIATSFVGHNAVALGMTALIGLAYLAGALELHRFRQATAALLEALAKIPDDLPHLGPWLDRLPASLQNAVRLRIEGERAALPGPVLTPYLVGLLVMLGMLGTFVGLVVTLNGAVFALEGTTDLHAIRAALAAPIKGLGLAFGTSVAGVAASAMLGLMSAISRRERLQASQLLDSRIATVLRDFSLAHQRQETFKALQQQSQLLPQLLPQVVDKLQALLDQMERRQQQLGEQLLDNQTRFHQETRAAYTDLAAAVEKSLRTSLADSARLTGESLKPVLETALAGMAGEAAAGHARLIDATRTQIDSLAQAFTGSADRVAAAWQSALAEQSAGNARLTENLGRSLADFSSEFSAGFEARSAALLGRLNDDVARRLADQASGDAQRLAAWQTQMEAASAALQAEWRQAGSASLARQQELCATLAQSAQEMGATAQAQAARSIAQMEQLLAGAEALLQARRESEAAWMAEHQARLESMASLWQTELGALRAEEAERGQAAVARLGELQTALAGHLTSLGTALEAPITRLLETASEAPRAAAEVIAQLRQEMSASMARDNQVLDERNRLLTTLNTLLEAINHASGQQRSAIDALVASAAELLERSSRQFADQVQADTGKLADTAAQVAGSAIEVASLGESFGVAVRLFSASGDKLVDSLARIEAALEKSMQRSDDQLAYYVAQAREVIDLSLTAQKDVVDDLRRLADAR